MSSQPDNKTGEQQPAGGQTPPAPVSENRTADNSPVAHQAAEGEAVSSVPTTVTTDGEPLRTLDAAAPEQAWREHLKAQFLMAKNKRGEASLIAWLNQIGELDATSQDELWKALKQQDITVTTKLLLRVTASAENLGRNFSLYWMYERLMSEAQPLFQIVDRYCDGLTGWDEYVRSLKAHIVPQKKELPKQAAKALGQMRVAYAVMGISRRRTSPLYPECLMGLIAASAGPEAKRKPIEYGVHDVLVATIGAVQSKAARQYALLLGLMLEDKVRAAKSEAAKEQARAAEAERIYREVTDALEAANIALESAEGRAQELSAELVTLRGQVEAASERYELLSVTSERMLAQEKAGLIHQARVRIVHDLSEIEIALEGRENEREAGAVLRRTAGIRAFLDSLGVEQR